MRWSKEIEFGITEFQAIKEARLVRAIDVGVEKLCNWFPDDGRSEAENYLKGREMLKSLRSVRSLLDNTSVIESSDDYRLIYEAAKRPLEFVRAENARRGVCHVKNTILCFLNCSFANKYVNSCFLC